MGAEQQLRHQEASLSQQILDVQAEMTILNRRHTELVNQRVDVINELGKFAIARMEV